MNESCVAVAVRIRPILGKEQVERCTSCVEVLSETELLMGGDKQFTFDHVYAPSADQALVYESVAPLVDNFFGGYNATVLAYGQTGSGKTFTMGTYTMGCGDSSQNSSNSELEIGVIPRATAQVFDLISQKRASCASAEFYLRIQFLELYGETLRDLLDPVGTAQGKLVSIRDGPNDTLQVVGAVEDSVTNPSEMIALLDRGTLCRTTGSTDMNSHSSRSHAIFTIILEQHLKQEDEETEIRISKFHFVDLAGSERAKRTRATGQRLKEGININMGLLALGNVISALGSEEAATMNRFVPYRDSKLTRMLQDSLGGNSKTLMIACVSPADCNFEETLNALRYANRARNIKNRAVINRDPKASQIAELKSQIAELKLQISQKHTPVLEGTNADPSPSSEQHRYSEGDIHHHFLEAEVSRLNDLWEHEKRARNELLERYLVLEAERVAILGLDMIEEEEEQCVEEANGLLAAAVLEEEQQNIDEGRDEELQERFEKSQKYLRRIVSKYDETLKLKQEAMKQIVEERAKFEALKAHFESKMAEMNEEVRETQLQRDSLESKLRVLESMEHTTDTSKSEALKLRVQLGEKDKRLKDLEERTKRLNDAKKAAAEWQKKESVVRLEIEHFKREKVEYQRKLNENQKRYIEELKERRLEIAGLKRERARLEQDTSKLSAQTDRDFKLIQRKSEQVAAMQRKLREAQRLTCVPQTLSDRERNQRQEIERLAQLQVKREEELLDLRRALAKKEDAISRRDRLLAQLEKLKGGGAQPSAPTESPHQPVAIHELVPEATEEDMKELEQRLEAVNSEIVFRDMKCREVLENEEHSRDEDKTEQIMLSFNNLDQAKEVCQVLMQMFVESKRELRERKKELTRVQDEFVIQDHQVKLDRRRTETLLGSSAAAPTATTQSPSAAPSLMMSFFPRSPPPPSSAAFVAALCCTPEKTERKPRLDVMDSEVRIKNIEATLKSLRVEDSSGGKKKSPLQPVPYTVPSRRTSKPSNWESVVDRLTSPSNATGIHKYGRRVSYHATSSRSLPPPAEESFASKLESSVSPKFPPPPPPLPESSYMRMTESQRNKQQLDAEARKSSSMFLFRGGPKTNRLSLFAQSGLAVPGKENTSFLHKTLADERKRRRNRLPSNE